MNYISQIQQVASGRCIEDMIMACSINPEMIRKIVTKITYLASTARAYALSRKNRGYCHCCRSRTVFLITGDWLRDQYICSKCKSIPRQRHVQYILDLIDPDWTSKRIHESSPSNDYISRHASNYSSSQFLSDVEFGTLSPRGARSENLEQLTFPSDSFEIFITQDVFEHIFDPERASKEIARVLSPGGMHIFTAPKYRDLRKSFRRAIMLEDGSIRHTHEPEYHGNPVGDGKSLVTWRYGNDFEKLLAEWSGLTVTTYITRDRSLGIDGEFIEVFVMRKNRVFPASPSRE